MTELAARVLRPEDIVVVVEPREDPTGVGVYLVPSDSTNGTFHYVFPLAGICTCPANDRGTMCKHLACMLLRFELESHAMPCTAVQPRNRMLAAWLAGDPLLPV